MFARRTYGSVTATIKHRAKQRALHVDQSRRNEGMPAAGEASKPRMNNPRVMKAATAGLATTLVLWGGPWPAGVQAQPGPALLGHGPIAIDNGDWGPPRHWCPGQQPVPTTGNHITDPIRWDWNVCHTYYYVWPGMGNVSNVIWDGDNPPPKPPPPPALNFCPIPPWCP